MELGSDDNSQSAPAERCEFFVDTAGHCFLCFGKIEASSSLLTPAFSLQYLCHYLKLDKMKLFNEAPILHQVLANVNKMKLYVVLCKGCAATVGKFNRLFRKLEKIQMGIIKCLDKIKGEMGKRGGGNEGDLPADMLGELDLMDLNKIIIAQRFRRETIQKCSKMLNNCLPRVKLERLTNVEKREDGKSPPNCIENALVKQETSADSEIAFLTDSKADEISLAEEGTPVIKSSVSLAEAATSKAESNPTSTKAELTNPSMEKIEPDETLQQQEPPANSNGKTFCISRSSTRHNESCHAAGNARRHSCRKSVPRRRLIEHVQRPDAEGKASSDNSSGNGKSVVCRVCGKTFCRRYSQKRHYESVHLKIPQKRKQKPSTCNLCGKQFSNIKNRSRHIQEVHLRKRKHDCEICDKIFWRKCHLTRHVELVHSKSSNQEARRSNNGAKCNLCGRMFSSKDSLKRHIMQVHTRPTTGRIACNLCTNKSFANSLRLKLHYEGFHFNQGYMCDLCPKSYSRKFQLDKHRKNAHFQDGSPNFDEYKPSSVEFHRDEAGGKGRRGGGGGRGRTESETNSGSGINSHEDTAPTIPQLKPQIGIEEYILL